MAKDYSEDLLIQQSRRSPRPPAAQADERRDNHIREKALDADTAMRQMAG